MAYDVEKTLEYYRKINAMIKPKQYTSVVKEDLELLLDLAERGFENS